MIRQETPAAKPRLRGVSHQVAAVVFPFMGVVAVLMARPAGAKVAVAVYTAGVTAMYATSATYHRGNWSAPVKRRLRRLDHSMILVGIASTYTPVAGIGIGGTTGRVVLAVVWSLAAVGALVRNLWLDAPSWLVAVVYVGVGWTAVAVLPAMWTHLGVVTFLLVLAGGSVYSLGALVFSRRRPDPWPAVFGFHEVFHALVLLAGLLFWVVVLRVAIHA
ncbi:MAG TPA: hemolysin III family protein [Acidimicrobiales bacterium]|nr:hemolysin III family protein [Acidimicrobiales bacterium]